MSRRPVHRVFPLPRRTPLSDPAKNPHPITEREKRLSKHIKIKRNFNFHKQQIITLAYFPSIGRLVSCAWDKKLIFSDIMNKEEGYDPVLRTIDLDESPSNLLVRKFTDDFVLCITSKHHISSFNIHTLKEVAKIKVTVSNIRTFQNILNDDLILVSPNQGKKLYIVSYKKREVVREIETPLSPTHSFGYCRSKKYVGGVYINWVSYRDRRHGVMLLDFSRTDKITEKKMDFKIFGAWSGDPVVYHDKIMDREIVVSGGDFDGRVQFFDTVEGNIIKEFDVKQQVQVMKIVDDQFLFVGYNSNGKFIVYDVKDGFKVVAEKTVFSRGMRDLQIIEVKRRRGEVKIVCSGNSSEVAIVKVKGLKFFGKSEMEMEDEKERIQFLEGNSRNIFFERSKEFCVSLKVSNFEMEVLKLFLRL